MSYRSEGRQLWKYWEPLIHREGSRIERWTLPFEPTNDPDAFERGEWFRYDQLSQMDAAVEKIKEESAAKDAEIARLRLGVANLRGKLEAAEQRIRKLEEERDQKVAAHMIAGFEQRIRAEVVEQVASLDWLSEEQAEAIRALKEE